MASHNRRELTLASIQSLLEGHLPDSIDLALFLLDDASDDQTAGAVSARYPEVTVVPGSGSMYWSGGMRAAFDAASSEDPDFYLWLNDDTMLDAEGLSHLLETYWNLSKAEDTTPIVVGALADPDSGDVTYGGILRRDGWRPLRYERAGLSDVPQQVDTFNGNCVLIPREIVARIGHIDGAFVHVLGDYDYGLRATVTGFSAWVASGTVGTCSNNSEPPVVPRGISGALTRLQRLLDPKGHPPRVWLVYTRRHAGPLWPVFWIGTYVKAVFIGLTRSRP